MATCRDNEDPTIDTILYEIQKNRLATCKKVIFIF